MPASMNIYEYVCECPFTMKSYRITLAQNPKSRKFASLVYAQSSADFAATRVVTQKINGTICRASYCEPTRNVLRFARATR